MYAALCMGLSLMLFGLPSPGRAQSQDAEKLLKELEKLEAKTAQPRLRPAAGKPVEEVAEQKEESVVEKPSVQSSGLIDSTAFVKLSPAQQKLIVSYDNFVSLFPNHTRVPELMYNTGARYFEVELYPNARKVYERLLNEHPNSGTWYVNAMSDVVESYRRESNFDSLEVWSERLRTDANAPDSLREASERLASGAIANKANKIQQLAAESGDTEGLIRAAEEYIRTARTYPKAEFASISLYNAGFTYKKAKALDKAAEVWLDLVTRYPEISYGDSAMWNAALAYDELKQYDKALTVYEQFVERFPASGFRVDALKNSIYDYGEVQNWSRTAQTYEQYATEFPQDAGPARSYNVAQAWLKAKEIEKAAAAFDRFAKEDPKNPKVNEVQFELGQAWIKQGDLEKANLAFARFARQNPENPLSVKIQYDVGEFYYERQRFEEARNQYLETIKVSQNLEKRNLDGNAFYRAEAYMRLASMTYPDFEVIKLALPKATFDANLTKKKEIGKTLADYYEGVIVSGSIRGAEAAYKLSELNEHMANTWLAQEQPPAEKDVLKRVQQIRDLNDGAIAFLEQAITPLVAVNIKRAGEYADIKFDTTWTATRDSILSVTKVDSTESQWVTRAKQKVVTLAYRVAELATEDDNYLIDHFYDFVQVPKPTKELIDQIGKEAAEFLFTSLAHTTGLDTLSAQILRNGVPAYQRVMDLEKPEPEGYSLRGPEIRRAQEQALNLALRPVQMNEVRIAPVIADYEKLAQRWVQLTDSLMYRPQTIRDVFAFGDQLYKILDGGLLPMYVDESLKLVRDMSLRYENVIQKTEEMGIEQALVDSLKIHMVKLYYDMGMKYQSLAQFADGTINRYFTRVAEIDSIIAAGGPIADKLVEADATTVLNDMTTQGWDELNFNLRNAALETYEAGYGYKDIYPIAGAWYGKIRTQLTEIDPQLYPPPSEEYRFELTTDGSWMVSPAPSGNAWTMSGFTPDAGWRPANISPYPVFVGTLPGLGQTRALPIWGAGPDSSGMGADSLIYARKEFMVFGTPDSAVAIVAATAPFELLMNGLSVARVTEVDPNTPHTFNLTGSLMAKSRNVVGLVVLGSPAQQHSVLVDVRGVDRVPQAAENIDRIRQYYKLPPAQRTLPE
jgi:TolA-binding protein